MSLSVTPSLSLWQKFFAAFSLVAMLAISLAAYGVHALSSTSNLIARLYDEPLMGVNYARAASATLNEARGLMDRALSLQANQSNDVAGSLRAMEIEIAADLGVVRRRVHDERVTMALDQAETSIAAWFNSGQTIFGSSAAGITALPMPDVVERQSTEAVARLDDLVEQVAANGFAYRTRAETEMRASSIALICLSGGIIATSALTALLFGWLLIRPIGAATHVAEAVAAGNIATVIATTRRDEIGRLLSSLATMQANLRDRDERARILLRERELAAETLGRINFRFDTALNNMAHGLMMCDGGGRVVVINRRFCDIYGMDPGSLSADTTYSDVLALSVAAGNYAGRTVGDLLDDCAQLLVSHQRCNITRTLADGRAIAIAFEPMPDGGWIAIHEDITERRRSEARIDFLARHDPLTLLPNRLLFQERLEQALALAARGRGFALLCLDLDKFKMVNDTLGHPIGDRLLRAVADRLREVVRETDTIARLGGDEFAILELNVTAVADATMLARRIIQSVGRPYEFSGHRVVVGVSIGIALTPGDSVNSVELFKNADLALYRAKQDGRGIWRFYDPAMEAVATARRALEADLRDALPLGQLQLHYQPVVCSRTRVVTGFEALLRWFHPTRGMVPPSEFISVAEDIGVIIPIGIWVLHQACAEAATWPAHVRVAINISSLQFGNQTLVATVAEVIRQTGIAPERVELEITESVVLRDDQATLSALHALRALGVRIAMDDFGTGYSSLSYLRSFPFNTIKIDKSFVDEVQTREEAVAIIRAVTGLASVLHMNTTAEGIETPEQLEILTTAGCTELQGYLFSKPVPAALIPALIERLSGRPVPLAATFADAAA
jgi:diguanylate cyclase (GGDEF)-like protein